MTKFDIQLQCEELEEINQGGAKALPERKSMKAILYNVEDGYLYQVNIKDYKDIQRVLAFKNETSVTFDAVYFQVGDTPVTVYLDDEGLLKDEKTYGHYASILCNSVPYNKDFASTPLVGNLLFTMADKEGETIDLDVNIKEIAKRIYPYMERGKNLYESKNLKAIEIL